MAYAAYVKDFRSKFIYFMRTIKEMDAFLGPIDEEITNHFIPTFFGSDTHLPDLRDVFRLNANEGALGIHELAKEAKEQHDSSDLITAPHVISIINQENIMRLRDSAGNTQ